MLNLKTKKITSLIATFVHLIMLPFVASAVELEQTYPELSATKSLTKTSSIAELISYLSTWAIVIAVLAVVINLIVAGLQYLTSAGRPSAMTEAKSRIFRSISGLAILAVSYLILVTINPQLIVLQIEYVPVETGLFLFTEQGYKEFTDPSGFTKINDLIKQNQIYPIMGDMQDMSASYALGMLGVEKWEGAPPDLDPATPPAIAAKVSFINFPLYALGFWGLLEQDAKVIMYSQESFQGKKYEYVFKGKLDEQGAIKRDHGKRHGMKLMVFNLDFDTLSDPADPNSHDADFFKTTNDFKVDYVNLSITTYSQLDEDVRKEIDRNLALVRQLENPPANHQFVQYGDVKSRHDPGAVEGLIYPPLSLQIRKTGPGVYLYANADNHNEERRYTESHDDLSRDEIPFDKKAEKIKLINTKTVLDENNQPIPAAGEQRDYLAILHEDPYYTGNLRLFFEQRFDDTEQIPRMCDSFAGIPESDYGKPRILSLNTCGYNDFETDTASPDYISLEDYVKLFSYYLKAPDPLIIGNMGHVDDPLDPNDAEIALEDMLLAITLPLEIGGKEATYGKVEYVSSVSVFELNPDPRACKEVRICTEKGFEIGELGGDGYCISYSYEGANTKAVPEVGVVKFPMPLYQPVNIPDKAMVVKSKKETDGSIEKFEEKEFAQKIQSLYIRGDCLVALFENKIEDWPVDGPGSHSQLFPLTSKQDLSGYEINKCGSWLRGISGRYFSKPCAQAIAVYPIKRQQ